MSKRRQNRPKRAARPRAPEPEAARERSLPTETPPDPIIAEVPRPESDLVVAGVGASAGGLEAFSQLLEALPSEPGLAIVLVQHLAPQHESALPVLLASRTTLPVVQATENMELKPNHVYVIPPNVQMGVADGRLHLLPRPSDRSQYTPID